MVIIESATHSDNSVVAIVEEKVNGNQFMTAVRVGGRGKQNRAITLQVLTEKEMLLPSFFLMP